MLSKSSWHVSSTGSNRDLRRILASIFLLFSAVTIGGCRTNYPPGYGPLNSPQREVREALDANDPITAASRFESNLDYYQASNFAGERALRTDIARSAILYLDKVAKDVTQELQQINPSPNSKDWESARVELGHADEVISEDERFHKILGDAYSSPPAIMTVRQLKIKTENALRSFWREAFLAFEWTKSRNFLDDYPVSIEANPGVIESENPEWPNLWTKKLINASTRDIADSYNANRSSLSEASVAALRSAFIQAGSRQCKSGVLNKEFRCWSDEVAYAESLVPKFDLGSMRPIVYLYQPARQRDSSLFKVGPDNPLVKVIESLNDVPNSHIAPGLDWVVVVAPKSGTANRSVSRQERRSSQRAVGSRSEPNPYYAQIENQLDLAKIDLLRAESELNRVSSIYCEGFACIAKISAMNRARDFQSTALSNVQYNSQLLSSIPMTIEAPVLEAYSYNVVEVNVRRKTEVIIEIFDRGRRSLGRDVRSLTEEKLLKIPYGIDDQDPKGDAIRVEFDDEAKADEVESGPLALSAGDLLAGGNIPVRMDRIETGRAFAELKTAAETPFLVRSSRMGTARVRPARETAQSDSRSNAVVLIENPSGSVGAGFFVSPNRILTNQHVVEGSGFVVVRNRKGDEGVGRVVKSDLIRDLALISSDLSGPISILGLTNDVAVGATVETIGHPRGLSFSLTRGIVSAIRRLPSDVGGGDVLVIQTDASLSPGNSGGPLFLGDRVIGICTSKLVDSASEGLGFAVHASEIEQFLAQ